MRVSDLLIHFRVLLQQFTVSELESSSFTDKKCISVERVECTWLSASKFMSHDSFHYRVEDVIKLDSITAFDASSFLNRIAIGVTSRFRRLRVKFQIL